MTDIDREKLRELCERAPGPWTILNYVEAAPYPNYHQAIGVSKVVCANEATVDEHSVRELAVAARTALPALLDLTDAQAAENEKLKTFARDTQVICDAQAAKIAELEAENWKKTKALEAENERLGRLVYVPGIWRCAKCNFRLAQSNLNIGDGMMTARDDAGDTCPNCNSLLWRVSERDERHEAIATSNKLFDDLDQAKTLIASLESERHQLRERHGELLAAYKSERKEVVKLANERDQLRKQVEAMNIIDQLRTGEGNCVTFVCDNHDFNGQPNCAIEVCAEWTAWAPRRFAADTVLDCLRLAAASTLEQKEQE